MFKLNMAKIEDHFGREKDMWNIISMLKDDNIRLVTIYNQ